MDINVHRRMNVFNYPKLPEEFMERAPVWDDSRNETALLTEVASRFGLTIREFLLWHVVHETKQRDASMWAKTTPRALREWYKAIKREMAKGARSKFEPDPFVELGLGQVGLN